MPNLYQASSAVSLMALAVALTACSSEPQNDAQSQVEAALEQIYASDESEFKFGLQAVRSGEYVTAAATFQGLVERDYLPALYELSRLYIQGLGVPQDQEAAKRLLTRAAEGGMPMAQITLASLYDTGAWGEPDRFEAHRWFKEAAYNGVAEGQIAVAYAYYNGDPVIQDKQSAAEWAAKAANQGNADAQFLLGDMYRQGDGVSRQPLAGVSWLRKAATQGHLDSMYVLGIVHLEGEGAPQDLVTAHMWFNLAAAHGHEHGATIRSQLEAEMAQADISQAHALARQWTEKNGEFQ